MLQPLLRFLDIALAVTVAGLLVYISLGARGNRVTSADVPESRVILTLLLSLGLLAAGADFLYTGPHTVKIRSTGFTLDTDSGVFGVYHDVTGTSEVKQIDWGIMEPGSSGEFTLWVKNEDVNPVMVHLSTGDWVPETAADFFTVSWNWGDAPLYPSMSRKVTITLTVDPGITQVTDFSFNIVLTSGGT